MSDSNRGHEASDLPAGPAEPVGSDPARDVPGDAATQGDGPSVVEPSPPVEPRPEAAEQPESEQAAVVPAEAGAQTEPGQAEADAQTEPGQAESDASESKNKPARPSARVARLYRAMRSKRAVSGRIEKVIKGGYEVRVGKTRGFCPHSQIDLLRVDDPESFVGRELSFLVTQVRRGGDDVVLSRRTLLEDEQAENAKAVRATLVEGAVMQGHVAGTADFGVFVDLGAGVKGLVHVSELSHQRVTKVEEAFRVGDSVSVKVLKVDDRRGRISLSIRQATEDPWQSVAEKFHVGEVYAGQIQRVTDFGAFVELAPGVEALAPASEFPPSPGGNWREGLDAGLQREWLVLSVSPERKRISICLPGEGPAAGLDAAIKAGDRLKGRVQRVERFGVFVWLGPGRVGLMPNVLTGVHQAGEIERRFPTGEEIEVEVVDVEQDGRRLRLAKPGVQARLAERADRDRGPSEARSRGERGPRRPGRMPAEPISQPPSGPFGTHLAEKLKAALNQASEQD